MAGIALPQLAPASEDRVSGALVAGGCVKFDGDNNQYLKRTFSAGNRTTWTFSTWIKRSKTSTDNNNQTIFEARGGNNDTDFIQIKWRNATVVDSFNVAGWSTNFKITSQVFRDYSAWYHVVVSANTNDTSGNRLKIYINGEVLDSSRFQTNNSPGSGANTGPNGAVAHHIGYSEGNSGQPADFYMSQTTFIDGVELGSDYFAYADPLTGAWRPKKFRAEGTTKNDGTQWSSFGSGTLANGNWGQAFDGNRYMYGGSGASNGPAVENGTITFAPPNLKGRYVRMGVRGGSNKNFTVNDKSMTFGSSNAEVAVIDLGTTQPIASIKAISTSGGVWAQIYWVEVDGILLKDSTTTNLTFGTNGFYLPMDGNLPIGQDQSGNGNDWTPVNFGGSVSLDNPIVSGARPILNTDGGGTIARAGVFGGDVSASYATTSASNSGGKYYFSHDASAQPTFSFIRGATYVFDWSASSGHPLRFATAADAAGSTEYTDGTNVTGNVTKITVPHNAPDTLYYYCNVHNGMGNSISVTTDETKADKYASSLVLACPYAYDKEDVSGLINCTVSNKGSDNYGSIQRHITGSFYNGSRFFDGSNDNINYSSSSTLGLPGAFTIEMYATPSTVTDGTPISSRGYYHQNGNWYLKYTTQNGGKFQFYSYSPGTSNGQTNNFTNTGTTDGNKIHHIVCQRDSSNLMSCMVDGVLIGQASNVTHNLDDGASNGLTVGRMAHSGSSNNAHAWYAGYVGDLRIYKGIEKYDVSGKSVGDQIFIPASTSPDILPDSPSGVAVKSRLKKITDGSVFIDRSSNEYLQAPASTNFRLDGQYCIEYFLNLTDYSNDSVYVRTFILDGPTGDGGSTNIHLNVNPSTGVLLFWSGSSELIGGTISIAGGKLGWHHVCLTRDSSNKTRLFIDGVLSGSADITTDYNLNSNQNRPRLGALGTTGGTSGYYSNWRITKGSIPTEYQTSTTTNGTRAFFPPTEALTTTTKGATANDVKLLACQSLTSPTAATVTPNTITTNGAPQSTNFNPFNTDINTVRGQEGNYATLNPLLNSKFQSKKLINGNLVLSGNMSGGSGYPTAFSNFTMNGSGKFYMEATPLNMTDTGGLYIGLCDDQMISLSITVANTYPGGPGGVAYAANGTISDNNSNTFTSQPTYTGGDVISVAYDADNGKVYFAKNGVYINDANPVTGANPHDTGRTGDQYFVVGGYENRNVSVNFGQKPFSFPPPDGYQPLTSSTLRSNTVITRPDKYFAVNLYKGNGASSPGASGGTQTIDVGHKPDLIWIKDRTQDHDHNLIDTIRGAGSILMSNATTAPPITNSTDAVTAFTDKGFTLGDNGEGTQSLELNKNGNNYVVWSWVAGGTPTATNDNTSGAMDANSVSVDGVLQSAYTPSGSPNIYPKKMSVGTKQGFSIIEYGGNSTSGAKVPHGLTQAPDFMVIKTTTLNGQGWGTYHQGIGATKYLQLQVTDHQSNDYSGFLNNTAPTNQVFTLGNDNFVNTGHTYMAYCWHDVPGLQKFGTFIGNNSTNFVELGFKPAMVWVKRVLANSAGDASDNYTSWTIMDHKRLSYNGTTPNHMYCNRARAEGYRGNGSDTSSFGDMTLEPQGTGFIMTGPGSEVNSSTGKYIYCAWAETPAFNLYGGQSSAR